jgi:hypothetical protein
MGNIIDFAELRRRIEQHDAEARRMAREIKERMKKDERCDPEFWEATDIFYPWDERPWNMPLHPYEIDIVMRAVNMDMALAAKKFHMTVERLEAEQMSSDGAASPWRIVENDCTRRRKRLSAKPPRNAQRLCDSMFAVERINGRELKLRVRKPGFPHNVTLTKRVLHVIDARMHARRESIEAALEAAVAEGLGQGGWVEPMTKEQRARESRMRRAVREHFKD